MIPTILLAMALPAVAPVPAPACASHQPADHVAGRWIGEFAGADWTFELTRNATGWSGRYQSSRAQGWRPLEAVSVTGGCATFSLKSEPRVTFVVTLDAEFALDRRYHAVLEQREVDAALRGVDGAKRRSAQGIDDRGLACAVA